MERKVFEQAAVMLQAQFDSLNWTLHEYRHEGRKEHRYHWPGLPEENIMVVVHKSNGVAEEFHRHNFFFINFTYKGYYESLSQTYNNRILIGEGEIYAGQPLAGHALFAHDNHDTIVIGLLIKQEYFYRFFLPLLPTNSELFRFFLDPKTRSFADEYIHFKPPVSGELRTMLEMMVVEYASGQPDTQTVLRSLAISYLTYIVREYASLTSKAVSRQASARVREYLHLHFETASLTGAARMLGYHPNYLSALIKKETGNTFSELLLQVRMERAAALLENTSLSINEIALLLGYSNTSNFYKAFKEFYQVSPRNLETNKGNNYLRRY